MSQTVKAASEIQKLCKNFMDSEIISYTCGS